MPVSGDNLRKGQPDGDRGRSAGGRARVRKHAPADCEWCQARRYVDWHQHIGHLGFAAYVKVVNRGSIRKKLKGTVRKR